MPKLKFFIMFFSFISCTNYSSLRINKDFHHNFNEIKTNYIEGKDYSVEVYDKNSEFTILAIHGGELEKATSLIARNIAGREFNLYIFNAWLGKESKKLHITSSNFDDIRALNLAEKSKVAISIHGQMDKGKIICIGGGNETLKKLIANNLQKNSFNAEVPCKRLPGSSEKNIVNRAKNKGVQLEITINLLTDFDKNRDKLLKFTNIIRDTIFEYQKTIERGF